ncbi:glycoside hydrolase family 3 C-terminal domain-containing protein [Microbacterium sp.]|uniref:glycoside hydrolase family 3 C-terminal domain-containing protein n=1 Tax=Microbacterium sp. TaxID=51671 RepID=UPI003A91C60F
MPIASPREFAEEAARIVAQLSIEQMASLCSGEDFWNTKDIAAHGIKGFMLTDGPHGLRKQATEADHLGLNESVPATCFPSGAGLAASWNRDLLEAVGHALGREAAAEGVGVLLGPAINIKRHPLGGRNFEYLSEDPLLTGELAAAYINGVQAEGVGASVKHFAVNNQETNRLLVDVIVDQQALREIYLRGFEIAVKSAKPWTVMSAYNKINGTYASDDPWLLREVLRDEWGYDGVVVSDWGAEDDRVAGLQAGMGLEMPGNDGLGDAEIVSAIDNDVLDRQVLEREATRIIALHLAVADAQSRKSAGTHVVDFDAHHELARRAAVEATVLLANDGALPIREGSTIGILGEFSECPRFQGGGSSRIHPTRIESLLSALAKRPSAVVSYAPGYRVEDPNPDNDLLADARELASQSDIVVVMVGLASHEESEGFDRSHMRLSAAQNALVEVVCKSCDTVVVVLSNGAPVEMPWIDDVAAVLEANLGGQASGGALADVLFGDVEPSGRLAETIPVRIEDSPAYLNFPGTRDRVEYREGHFVGYRFYDTVDREPRFPFGHGLGYSDIRLTASGISAPYVDEAESIDVWVELRNVSSRPGSQVVQVYSHQQNAQPARPEQELIAFDKVFLQAGERYVLHMQVGHDAFRRWDVALGTWVVDDNSFELRVGTSSRSIAYRHHVAVRGRGHVPVYYGRNTALGSIQDHPVIGDWARALRARFVAQQGDYGEASPESLLVDAFSRELPLRSLVRIGRLITQTELERACRVLDGSASAEDTDHFRRLSV